jgi:microcystin-dependent protein
LPGGGYELASTGGEATHTLSTSEMPSHNHGLSSVSGSVSGGSFVDSISPSTSNGDTNGDGSTNSFLTSASYTTNSVSGSVSLSGSTDNTGDGGSHNNMPPFMAIHFIIKAA